MATAPELHEPQIAAARAQAWHQTGDPLLTLEAARAWLNDYGLMFFAPHPALGAPAGSLVEATLGAPKSSVLLGETEVAHTLTARLVGEGSAVPLNLLGGPGDLPDFLVSAQAFPFIFTLRGDKGWKRPPETSGAVKVTPLGLRVYEVLADKGALAVGSIVPEIGREVTESAVARALTELWQMLRVFPVLQQGQGETKWELTTTRFLKAVKAGANAGQPTALSALASLYLGQALVATEEEIAGFLSPLTARSRVRDVLHGLAASRQLTEGVVNGKTVLYVPDSLPDLARFAAPETADAAPAGDAETTRDAPVGDAAEAVPERIRRFEGERARPQDRMVRGKPVRREAAGDRPRGKTARPAESGFTRMPRSGGNGGRPPFEGRPARRDSAGAGRAARGSGAERPSFSPPWAEERRSRPPRRSEGDGALPRFKSRESRSAPGGERPFRPRTERGDGPVRPRTEGGDRPFRPRANGGDRPSRPRPEGGDRPFRPRPASGDRPFRPRAEGGDRPFRPRAEGGDRPFRPRPAGGDRPFRPRAEGGDRPFRARPEGGERPFRPRAEGRDRPFRPRPAGGDRPFRPRPEGGDRPAFRSGPGGRSSAGGAGRPGGGFRPGGGGAAFPPGSKRAGGAPSGGPKRPGRAAGPPRTPRTPRPEDEA